MVGHETSVKPFPKHKPTRQDGGWDNGSLETCLDCCPFAPAGTTAWVFLGIGERPSGFALLGGAVVLGVVGWYNLKKAPTPQPVD
jgi:hypothetical protein